MVKKNLIALITISASILIILFLPFRCGSVVSFYCATGKSPSQKAFLESERTAGMFGAYAFPQRQGRAKNRTRKQSPESEEQSKPDPLTLVVSIADLRLKLNSKDVPEQGEPCFDRIPNYGSIDDPSNLSACLNYIFQQRAKQFAFKRGMEQRTDIPLNDRIEKTVYLRSGLTLKDDQVTTLIEVIKTAGANPVVVLTEEEYKKKFGLLFEPIKLEPKRSSTLAPKVIEGGVLNGRALSLPKPAYPSSAKASHLSGAVTVRVIIDETGRVVSARALSGRPVFRKPSVDAALLATFAPTTLFGQAVKVRGIIVYNFVGE